MKSIFRKIAFVLALAMVVTMFPVMNASAANNGNKYARTKDATLYVGGDANGDYEGCWAAQTKTKTWMKEEGYKSSYKTSDDSVVTVSKYGYVEAVSVGKAEITATFSKKGEEDIVETFNVTVKKNAVSIALDKESQDALSAGLTAGDKVTLKAVQTDADGSNEGITDTVKFYCASKEDKEIIELNKDTGELTALKDGKATVVVQSCQYEYDRETKKYKTTVAAKAEYSVEVEAAGIVSAKQINKNTVAITCGNAAAAADLVANKTNLTVTYKIGEQDIVGYINYNEVKVDGSDDKVVNVTLYDELVKDYVYTFKYGEKSVAVTGVDLAAVTSIRIVTTTVAIGDVRTVEVKYYDANGVELPAEKMTGVLSFNVKGGDRDYFTLTGNQIYFLEAKKTAILEASYIRGYKNDGSADEIKSNIVTITSVEQSAEDNQVDGWAIGNDPNKPVKDWSYSKDAKSIAVNDSNWRLYGRYYVTPFGGKAEAHYTSEQYDGAIFEYSTTNDSVLMVDSASGLLYPVAAGSATVIVRRVYSDTNKPVIGTCVINVVGSRMLTSFTATADKNKLAIDPLAADQVVISTETKDQLGQGLGSSSVTYEMQVMNSVAGLTLTANSTPLSTTAGLISPDSNGKYVVKATTTNAAADTSVQVSITASQSNGRKITRVITLRVRKVTQSANDQFVLELGKSNIDMNIPAFAWNEGMGKLESSIRLARYDRDGFYVGVESMTPNSKTGAYSYQVLNSKGEMITVTDDKFSAVTASGSAVSGGAITKCPTGVYRVEVYKNGTLYTFKNIVVSDTTVIPTANVKNTKVGTTSLEFLAGSLKGNNMTFHRGNDEVTGNIDIVRVEGTSSNDRVYVTRILVEETVKSGDSSIQGYKYQYYINIGKTFYLN